MEKLPKNSNKKKARNNERVLLLCYVFSAKCTRAVWANACAHWDAALSGQTILVHREQLQLYRRNEKQLCVLFFFSFFFISIWLWCSNAVPPNPHSVSHILLLLPPLTSVLTILFISFEFFFFSFFDSPLLVKYLLCVFLRTAHSLHSWV